MNFEEIKYKLEDLPKDEKISYIIFALGLVFVLISFFLW